MAVFKIVNEPYTDLQDIYNALQYIYDPKKCIYHGSHRLLDGTPTIMGNQYSYIKNYYRKTTGKQMEHFILSLDSFGEESDIDVSNLITCAWHIIIFLLDEYQVAFSIHKKPNYHVHFIMNTVSMKSGKHFRLNKTNYYEFMHQIAYWLSSHSIALEGVSYYDANRKCKRGSNPEVGLYNYKVPQFF